ncbi:MAG: rhodanese-like domain-containing protein [Candidatus Zixiibacteriota bacterium]
MFATVLAIIVNIASGSRIPFVGDWPSISGSDSVAVPPSAAEGDPPFVSLDEAAARYQSPGTLFIDARDTEDYAVAHIRNAINIPYDYIDDFRDQLMSIPLKQELVIYCSGTECELSLFLGREMQDIGYQKIFIFYGGWREWERAGLPMDKGI